MDIETLTSILKAELGDILEMEEVCPCVFYVAAFDIDASLPCTCEYYVVRDNASMLSNKAKAYGRELSAAPELLIYPWSKDDSGWRIVKYEANLYLHKKGKLPDAEEELRDDIAFGREFHPDYFGCYPLPAVTPWGASVCYVELDPGIFWIVTRQRKELLCVCYPMWDELSDYSQGFAEQRNDFKASKTPDYFLFPKESACVPVYEMLTTRTQWLDSGLITLPQLMNAICFFDAKYVFNHNLTTQAEQGVLRQRLMDMTGEEIPPVIDGSQMIAFSPEVGTNYLHIEKALT